MHLKYGYSVGKKYILKLKKKNYQKRFITQQLCLNLLRTPSIFSDRDLYKDISN